MHKSRWKFILGGLVGVVVFSATTLFAQGSTDKEETAALIKSMGGSSANVSAAKKPVALPEKYFIPYTMDDLKLQVGDMVDISVFGQLDTIAVNVPVAPDGKIYYMFLKGIQAEGRTVAAVATEIEGKILHLFTAPEVTVIPTRFAANRVKIFGKVRVPGVYPLSNPITIRQAVARAQGISQGTYLGSTAEVADLDRSWIMRDGKVLPIDFRSLFKFGNSSQDIYVRPGDTIFIASAIGKEVYLLGAVPSPRVVPYFDDMSIVKLLAGRTYGGWTEDADIKHVVILRGDFPNPEMLTVNMDDIVRGRAPDIYLLSGDIVYMPQKSFLFARNLTKAGISILVRSFFRELGSDFTDKYLFPSESGVSDESIF